MIDVIVIGGGHAGIEAALASARMNQKTILYSIHKKYIGSMPCNPSIGGPAKGIVVREMDALGGEMGRAADLTALQFKMLNTTKGPGVQCLRVQSDKIEYRNYMQKVLEEQNNLEVIEAMVTEVLVKDNKILGIKLSDGKIVEAKTVILTTGTFMSSSIMVGHTATQSGPDEEPTTEILSQTLRDCGIKTFRLKTGTPARVATDSIDFTKTTQQPGTDEFLSFSYRTKAEEIRQFKDQLPCYLTYTAPLTHKIINDNLTKSAMYSGLVKGVGPRYCPSIEDKLVRFADKERHQLFLEPESLSMDTTYVQGFSTSMPHDVQDKMLRSLPGLENCRIIKYAYAIEYDAIDPLQMKTNMESKIVENLFTAGQINGTSGYEEAGAQGLMAGINASLKNQGLAPLVLRRDEAYIGVMIDDLVTKGTLEPYRLLTSRAEFRLLLRHDNADARLCNYGHKIGLLSKQAYDQYITKEETITTLKEQLTNIRFTPKSHINDYLEKIGSEKLNEGISALELLKRPNVILADLYPYTNIRIPNNIAKSIEIEVKYAGYIKKARRDAEHLKSLELQILPHDINYDNVAHLSIESRQKLTKQRPETMGQASRISGVNPSDITVLAMYIENLRRDNK